VAGGSCYPPATCRRPQLERKTTENLHKPAEVRRCQHLVKIRRGRGRRFGDGQKNTGQKPTGHRRTLTPAFGLAGEGRRRPGSSHGAAPQGRQDARETERCYGAFEGGRSPLTRAAGVAFVRDVCSGGIAARRGAWGSPERRSIRKPGNQEETDSPGGKQTRGRRGISRAQGKRDRHWRRRRRPVSPEKKSPPGRVPEGPGEPSARQG